MELFCNIGMRVFVYYLSWICWLLYVLFDASETYRYFDLPFCVPGFDLHLFSYVSWLFFFCLNLCSSLFLVSLGSICCQLSYFAKFVQEEETWQKSLKLQDFYPWTEIYGLLKFVFPGKFSSNSFPTFGKYFQENFLPENKINNKFPPPPPPCGRSWGCMGNFSQVSW